jgi:serine/threonine protein phosphatase PrpC
MSVIKHNAFCHTGTVRSTNEDAILSHPTAGVWAVADGMGGHVGGEFASQCLIQHLHAACERYKGNYLVERLRDVITQAHKAIYQHSLSLHGQPIIGSTIVILALEADNFHCFWTGDSRCYLYRDQQLSMLTEDHTEAQALIAHGENISYLSHELRQRAENTLLHAIGVDDQKPHIDYVSGYLYERDRFFLCSDGINKIFSDAEIGERLAEPSIETINRDFLGDALQDQAPDNLSSVIVSV